MRCVTFVRTCTACPEQYDALAGLEQVGYLRLRWGTFEARQRDVEGPVVYRRTWPGEPYKGDFDSDVERTEELSAAAAALGFDLFEVEEGEHWSIGLEFPEECFAVGLEGDNP